MGRIVDFELASKDYEFLLEFLKKGKANVREVKRAEVLLLLHNQVTGSDIEKLFRVAQSTSRRIRRVYEEEGLEKALFDSFRAGRPRIFSPSDKAKVTALACTDPPDGYGKWSLRLLAQKLIQLKYVESISKSQVGRILKKTK